MSYRYPIQSTGTPATVGTDKPPVRCGRCGNNGTGIRNPACTARVHDAERASAAALVTVADPFTADEMAFLLEEFSV